MLAFLSPLLFIFALLLALTVLGQVGLRDATRIAAVLRGRGVVQPVSPARQARAVRPAHIIGRRARPALLRDAA
ncbi:hypothetical protein [Sphingomonas flavalba]|uniref:hypothetical protein n=1 Tax=Sphingomonas flavalba TaxID=2559804 RepID=UPI00109DA496|nr:hypothetical protein [Sphingomonas flavalba]